jgi:DNA (cytosine-5)-methyltransferase 1
MGYSRAGFEVVGVDIKPQPRYPFEFIQAEALEHTQAWLDALDRLGKPASWDFDAIHASPPCQAYSNLGSLNGNSHDHPDLIGPTRELLEQTGLPYVIENVVGRAPLRHPFKLCGSSFGLRVWRHRLFETNWPMGMIPPCSHHEHGEPLDVTGTGGPGGRHRKPASLAEARNALGIDWMTRAELSEAIPPAFTEWIGTQLMAHLQISAVARTQRDRDPSDTRTALNQVVTL